MSKFRIRRNLLICALAAMGSTSYGDWVLTCPGPATGRFSTDFGFARLSNPLTSVGVGVSGTVAYNGPTDTPPGCLPSSQTGSVAGRIGFGAGTEGSNQTDEDNNLVYTWGMPGGVYGRMGYATLLTDGASTLIGGNGFSTFFAGASDTYVFGRTQNGDIQIELRVDLVGDASRCQFDFINLGTTLRTVGMRYGQHVALQKGSGASVGTPFRLGPTSGDTYITIPGYKPQTLERRWNRATDPAGFPLSVDFNWSQSEGIGLHIDNAPNAATTDVNDPSGSQTPVDGFVLGSSTSLLGAWDGGNIDAFPDGIFNEPISDVRFNGNTAFIQTWNETALPSLGRRRIVSYYRTPWGDSNYGRPYSVVVDTPKVINVNNTDPSQFAQNPFNIRVWVDNNRGFSAADQEIPLQDVRVELLLPDGMTPLGGTVRTISRIDARNMVPVDFTVQADDFAAGEKTYQVRVTPTPGPQKTITGVINVVSQPRLQLQQNANLVTSPWTFQQPVWESVLGMTVEQDFTAFSYDPVQKGYVISTGPERGKGTWIISRNARSLTLGGVPTTPSDFQPTPDGSGGAPLITIKQGWNLIANPYHVAIELGQLVGASNANPLQSFTFSQMVQQNLLNGSLATWDTATQNYTFIQRLSDRLEPQRGYWIRSNTAQDIVLRFPPVFLANVRSNSAQTPAWQQTANQWRLQLSARNSTAADDQNFVGVASSVSSAKSMQVFEPPIAPIKDAVSLSIEKMIEGEQTRMAQSLSETAGRQEFKVLVDSNTAGPVTVTWPNLATIPKNVRARIVDTVTGETRDLRKFSGYTFNAEAKLTREFKIQLEPGVSVAPVIGSISVNRSGGRANGGDSSVRLTYTLSADVTTSVRILSATGREVATLTRGRADKAGQNEVVWNLRDQAQRSVAPGTYRAEIVAEGNDGERTRKMHPFVIVR
jgi:hypothetical protein